MSHIYETGPGLKWTEDGDFADNITTMTCLDSNFITGLTLAKINVNYSGQEDTEP